MNAQSGSPQEGFPASNGDIVDAEIVGDEVSVVGVGQELAILTPGGSFGLVVDAVERGRRILDLHEASGVRLGLNPNIDSKAANMVCLEQINGDEDDWYTQRYVRLPANDSVDDLLVDIGESDALINWLIDLTLSHSDRGERLETDSQVVFIPEHQDDIVAAEQLTGRLLVARAGAEGLRNGYLLCTDIPISNMDNVPVLIRAERLRSPVLDHGFQEHEGPDELVAQVYSDVRYVIAGHSQTRIVSPSTLAIIDAGVQFASLSGLETIPMAILLAQIYYPDNFGWYDFQEGKYDRRQKMRISAEGVLNEIADRWNEDMGIEVDSILEGTKILDALAVREIDLVALVAEYGSVTAVETYDEQTSSVQSLPALPEQSGMKAVDLLQQLNSSDRLNVENYARLMVQAMYDTLEVENLHPGIVVEYLVDKGIISHDVASVHADELGALIGDYITLAEAKDMMEAAGIDTANVQTAFEAKLTEFIINNANAIRRTQALSPEVVGNLDTLLKIIERTGMKGRTLPEITKTIGRIASVQQRVLESTFPALVKGIRQAVTDELGIDIGSLVNNFSGDRTGATLYVASQAEADRIAEYVYGLLREAGVPEDVMPIAMTKYDDRFGVEIGSRASLKHTIPKEDWLPEGPKYFTHTRGH